MPADAEPRKQAQCRRAKLATPRGGRRGAGGHARSAESRSQPLGAVGWWRGQGQAPRERVGTGERHRACPERQAGLRAVAQAGRASVNVFLTANSLHASLSAARQLAAAGAAAHNHSAQTAVRGQRLLAASVLQAGSTGASAGAAGQASRQPAAGWRTHGVKSPPLHGRAAENAAACRCCTVIILGWRRGVRHTTLCCQACSAVRRGVARSRRRRDAVT